MFANWRTNSIFVFPAQKQEASELSIKSKCLLKEKRNPIKIQGVILDETAVYWPCSGHSKTAIQMDR